uniref:Uncharacterized protein n=1 Tax=Ciona savignyi TaxID=51511 RepID=H2YJH3_CIOSA
MIQFAGVTISNGDEIISDFNYANDDYCPANTESDYEDCNDEQTRIGFPNCTVGDSVLPDFTQSSQMYDDGGNY